MKNKTKEFLKKVRIITSLPIQIKFKATNNKIHSWKAKKGYYIVKWEDVLKAFRIEYENSKRNRR